MLFKIFSVAALAASAFGQKLMDLNATLASNNQTSALSGLLAAYPDLVRGLESARNVTLLAPSNNAIETLLNSSMGKLLSSDPGLTQAVLTYHVLKGTYEASAITNMSTFIPTMLTNTTYTNVTGGQVVEAITISGNVTFFSGLNMNASVVQPDVNFTGGVIHVIDNVLTLPVNDSATAAAANLTSLVGALGASKLVDTVDSLRDVTIFAPNNTAFQDIGSALANLSTNDLATILEYHVVKGPVGYSSKLKNGMKLDTVGGKSLTIHIENGTVFVNSAKVVTPDVLVSNGVVHVIDNVLNPNNTSAAPSSSATAGSPGFSGASSVSSAPFTSGVASPTTTVAGGASSAAASASSKSSALGAPMKTGAVGAAALFGAGAVMVNL
ncbi:Fasciclin-domain-containing protein [Rhizodiscina lignyota]|uniref:Fasciclin-domain-containing protein n=1 Tax=Rhizodiscina lignyota TaxID=1504668 RepID=A0A9P4M8F9_9PEZI|nr:Fasciclin-domain-containing protein [Rhizodiscina lignyota]